MHWDDIDWAALERLRAAFLAGSAGERDYWQSDRDLLSYDQTFAQRIRWKWDYVLTELKRRHWTPPPGAALDWGCGSGVAGRAWFDHFRPTPSSTLLLWDRSALALDFAKRRGVERCPALSVRVSPGNEVACETLLLSHVLTELGEAHIEALLKIVQRATAVLWVEPGTHETSRKLSCLRDQLRSSFNVVAPCTHQADCPVLASENAAHWCHHFASPPPEVFTDGRWARFAALAGIDLRSLPLSFLVLDKRPVSPAPACATRVLGRPRVYKAHSLLLGCDATGLHERRLSKRHLPVVFRQLKKGEVSPLQVWQCEANEILEVGDAVKQ